MSDFLFDFEMRLWERLGLCDPCMALIRDDPDTPLDQLVCDRCLEKINAFVRSLRDGDARTRDMVHDALHRTE